MPLKNPYPGRLENFQKVCGRVSPHDAAALERLFPFVLGLQDKIVSNLYLKFCESIRSHGLDPNNLDHVALTSDHPSIRVLESILDGFQGPPVGKPARPSNPSGNRSRKGRGVRAAHGNSTGVGPDSASGD